MNKEQEVNGGPTGTVQQSTNRLTTTGSTGGGQPHNILQPYIVTNYIIKAFQSAGTVATVVDNLNSTSTTDALSANQGNVLKNLLDGTVLYNNATGSSSSITLSQSVANFDYIEIYFAGVQGVTYYYNFTKINNPNNKDIALLTAISGADNFCFVGTIGNISNTTISLENNRRVWFHHDSSAHFDTTALIYITKVIGYKY